MAQAAGVYCVECPEAVDGMGVSLAAGIRASADAAGWVVALADMPFVDPVTIRRVAQAIEAGADVAAPFWRGERGHPVGFHRRLGPELAGLTGDEGARQVLARYRSSLLRIDVDDPGVLRDIDVPADLDAADEVSNPPGDRP
jgi:molybdenum cofactor cytidylyltransferase